MEPLIRVLIYVHAFFGGLFSLGMLVSSLISLPIAWLPGHRNLFLFLIGLFTIYLILSGNRVLAYKSRAKLQADNVDRLITAAMLLAAHGMLLAGSAGPDSLAAPVVKRLYLISSFLN